MKNWKTTKSKVVYKCKYFEVLEEDFLLSNARKSDKYYIIKRNDYVVVIPKSEDYLYLVEQCRYTTRSRLLEFAAGTIEKDETPTRAAKREMKEETGITAKKIRKIGWYYAYKGCSSQKAHIFLAEDLEFGKQEPEDLEKEGEIKVKKVKASKIKTLIKSGKIKDIDTIAAFVLFMLKEGCK